MKPYAKLTERGPGEINAFIAARALGMANFILQNNALLDIDLAAYAGRLESQLKRSMAGF